MSILAFHGTGDTVNPYEGGGDDYWGEGVLKVIHRWSDYDGCKGHEFKTISPITSVDMFTKCIDDTEVRLYKLEDGIHEWVDPKFLDVRTTIWEFFNRLPDRSPCHTATSSDKGRCYKHIEWARHDGMVHMPELYPGLNKHSTNEDIQFVLRQMVYDDCATPCAATTSTTRTTTTHASRKTTRKACQAHSAGDCAGNDTGRAAVVAGVPECKARCEAQDGCEYYVFWSNTEMCYVKSACSTITSADPNAQSYSLQCGQAVKSDKCGTDDPSRRRSGWSCTVFSELCAKASVSRRRNYGGEAADTCQSTCAVGLGCEVGYHDASSTEVDLAGQQQLFAGPFAGLGHVGNFSQAASVFMGLGVLSMLVAAPVLLCFSRRASYTRVMGVPPPAFLGD